MNHDIKVSHLTKKFGNVTAIDNVSIDVNDASCVGLLGPNGAGKSTMMKAITNILKPTSGRIEIGGVHVSSNPKKALKEVGSLVEYPKFYPYLTGLESLYFVCRIKGMKRKECQDEIERVAKLTGVSGYLDKKTGSYSRGMNQRVALSSALLCNPRVLILDEPTFGLDPKGMKEMRQLLKKINGEKESIILLSS
ncbi:MAG TPA: ABC transporter ATP-binding protein, partial [Thermoplasmataceae archaeon]|nr:ABC transporter ATP-binding protein [Thermoplasmataceae archaeon]